MTEVIELGEVRIRVTRKAVKNVHLSVHPPHGEVTLVAPTSTRLDVARAYAITKLGWIRNQQAKLRQQAREEPRQFVTRETLYLWGQRYLLEVEEKDTKPGVTWNHTRILLTVRPGSDHAKRTEVVHAWHKQLLHKAVPPLTALTHFDGTMGNWQGSGATAAEQVAQVVEASGVRARPLRQAREWGYQRVSSGRSVLIVDAAPPPIARMAVAGCASTLAFEFSNGGCRIISNCGGAGLVGATIPAALARGLRTTAAHSTLCIADSNSTSILADGKLGRGVSEVELFRRDVENATRLEASHDGYARRFGLVHKRLLLLRSDGLELRGEDMLIPDGKKRRRRKEDIEYAVRFHLGPDIESDLISEGKGVLLRLTDGNLWQFRSTSGDIQLEESVWVDGMGIGHAVKQMVIGGAVGRGGGATGWLLKHMG